jgi:hypothetical protein
VAPVGKFGAETQDHRALGPFKIILGQVHGEESIENDVLEGVDVRIPAVVRLHGTDGFQIARGLDEGVAEASDRVEVFRIACHLTVAELNETGVIAPLLQFPVCFPSFKVPFHGLTTPFSRWSIGGGIY